ncbi:MAG: glycosyltransferase family 4 protein [Aggregatilineales bacterium]
MNIGFISTRLAGVDGVSLETAKMVKILEEMGHTCFYCAGELDSDAKPGWLVPSMHFYDPVAKIIHDEVFKNPDPAPETFRRIYTVADTIRQSLEGFITQFNIDLIVPQNASTIPMNISLGVAIADVIKRTQIKTICHHHDFYWERERFVNNNIQDILDEAFPPDLKSVQHLTISTVMQRRLKGWRGIDALYLPNVFDFETPPPAPDEYANTFREELGIGTDDLIALQPTRIIRRKAIEKSIELIRKLNDDRIVLIITGYEGDEPGGYGDWLREEAERSGIRYKFIGEYVGAIRGEVNGHKVYTLWDIYPHAHFITYPSTYEGFGNALIETMYFRKPLIVHRYPAYVADIASKGVQAVEFYHDLTPEVLDQTRAIIDDSRIREDMVRQNYQAGLDHFSYQVLREVVELALGHFEEKIQY